MFLWYQVRLISPSNSSAPLKNTKGALSWLGEPLQSKSILFVARLRR